MSTSNKAEIERRRDQAQRERQAMAENEQEESRKRDRNLFSPPKKKNDDEEDETTQWLESLLGPWESVKWGDAANPVVDAPDRSSQRQSGASSSGSSQAKGQDKQRAHFAHTMGNSHHDSGSRNRYSHNTMNNHYRNESEHRHDVKRNSGELMRNANSNSSSRSHSEKSAWHTSQSRGSSQGSSSSHSKPSPVKASHPGSALSRRGTSPERDNHHPRELTHSTRHLSNHHDSRSSSERRLQVDVGRPKRMRGPTTPPSSPPPNHSAQCTPSPDPNAPSSRRTPTPVQHTPPAASHQTPPPQRTPPPPSQLDTKVLADTRPSLTLNIQREHKTRELDNIFREMAVETPLTALSETPVKCKRTPLFMFNQKSPQPETEVTMQLKPALSPLPDTEPPQMQANEARTPPPPPFTSSISEDLAVSDDSDMEEEEEQVAESKTEAPEIEESQTADVKKETNSSSDESSSSDDSSASDSDDSSSESGDENEEEVEEGEIKEEAPVVKKESQTPTQVATTPPEKKNGSWALSQFITKASPASVMKGGSGEDVPKVKASPRKISEIGPCNSMPFIVQDDPIPRNSEKASVSPDTVSTASSHTSSLDTGKAILNGRKDSPPDPVAYAKMVNAAKMNTPKARGQPKLTSSSESANVGKKECDEENNYSQQRKNRRTNSNAGAKKNTKSPLVTDGSSEIDGVVTIPPEAKLVSGKACNQQQAGEPTASPALPSISIKNKTGVKAKTPSRRDSTKSATRKKPSSPKDSEESMKSLPNQSASGTLTDIGSIMKDISVPQLLSPTIPSFSGEQVSCEPVPTMIGGRPSIVVRMPFDLLCRSPRAVVKHSHGSTPNSATAMKKGCGATKVTSVSTPPKSVSDCNRESRQSSGVSGTKGKTIARGKRKDDESAASKLTPPAKRKREEEENSTHSKRKLSNQSSPETNGVAHPQEVGSGGSKRVMKRRRSASSSSSSHSSHTSTAKDTPATKSTSPTKKICRIDVNTQEKVTATGSNEGKEVTSEDLPFDAYRQPNSSPKPMRTPTRSPAPPPPQPADNKSPVDDIDDALAMAFERHDTETFLSSKAKEYKHIADKQTDNVSKLFPYIRALLFYLMRGLSQEKQIDRVDALYKSYMEILSLCKFVYRLRLSLHELEPTARDWKLSVLILRIHSALCMRLYHLRRKDLAKMKKIIEGKDAPKKPMTGGSLKGHAPSPHWNKNSTGTPSPMSPTPSPSCSIGSVESQGSIEQPQPQPGSSRMTNGTASHPQAGTSRMTNGATTMSAPTIAVPTRVHSVTQSFVVYTGHMLQGHESWDQADQEIEEHGLSEFFRAVDKECGKELNLLSELKDIIIYVNTAMKIYSGYTPSS